MHTHRLEKVNTTVKLLQQTKYWNNLEWRDSNKNNDINIDNSNNNRDSSDIINHNHNHNHNNKTTTYET